MMYGYRTYGLKDGERLGGRCKIRYPHDFPDYPCKKCHPELKHQEMWNEVGWWLCSLGIAILLALAIALSL